GAAGPLPQPQPAATTAPAALPAARQAADRQGPAVGAVRLVVPDVLPGRRGGQTEPVVARLTVVQPELVRILDAVPQPDRPDLAHQGPGAVRSGAGDGGGAVRAGELD